MPCIKNDEKNDDENETKFTYNKSITFRYRSSSVSEHLMKLSNLEL